MALSGLILRIIPYSDNARILKCLTNEHGLQAYFLRGSKKSRNAGFIQTGKYIAFTMADRPSKMHTIIDCQPDRNLGTTTLPMQAFGVWLFTLELLNKTLEESFSIPGLRETVDRYYTHLSHGTISCNPLTPSLLLATVLGIWDSTTPLSLSESVTIADFRAMGVPIIVSDATNDDAFGVILNQFKSHFGFQTLDSLALLS